jgi:hypothetical protein
MRIRTLIAALVLAATIRGEAAAASDFGPFGAGIVLGEPTGITAKYWFTHRQAFQLGLSYTFRREAFWLGVDYLFHWTGLIKELPPQIELAPYIGAGLKAVLRDEDERPGRDRHSFGAFRFPLGGAVIFMAVPIEVFLEVAPGMRFAPETDFEIDGAIGARYYF